MGLSAKKSLDVVEDRGLRLDDGCDSGGSLAFVLVVIILGYPFLRGDQIVVSTNVCTYLSM